MRFRPLRPEPAPTGSALVSPSDPPATMRAAVIDSAAAGTLRTAELAVPAPVLSEVLVRVVAAGVNPIDAETRRGEGVADAIAHYPAALGFDFSGVVVKAPFEAFPFPAGTEVFGMAAFPRTGGTYAEYVVASAQSIARKPASLSHVEAAGVPLDALTAWGVVVETALAHEAQRILIHPGTGGVGHFAVQFAAYFGAHVTATGPAGNADWLRSLGAAVVVDHATQRFEDVVGEVDVVIDLVGNGPDDTARRSVAVLRPGGLLIEVPESGWPGHADAAAAAGVRATGYRVIPDGGVLATIARLLDSGAVQVYIDRVFELADAAAAHAELDRGQTRGTLVLRISDD